MMCFGNKNKRESDSNDPKTKGSGNNGEAPKAISGIMQIDKTNQRDKSLILCAFRFVAILFSLSMVYLIVEPFLVPKKELNEIKVSLLIPKDSVLIQDFLKENESQLNKMVDALNVNNQALDDKYNLLIKSKEKESDFFRLISVVVAFVVALIGFLGYRTVKDLEERVEYSAKSKAEDTAKLLIDEKMSLAVENHLNEMVSKSIASRLIQSQIMDEINKTISNPLSRKTDELDERVTDVEVEVERIKEGEFAPGKKTRRPRTKAEEHEKSVPDFNVPEDEDQESDPNGSIKEEGGEK